MQQIRSRSLALTCISDLVAPGRQLFFVQGYKVPESHKEFARVSPIVSLQGGAKIVNNHSDGAPAAAGQFPDLMRHLKVTVEKVEKAGIETIGIGIQTDAVNHYYTRNIVLKDLAALPATVIGELRKILVAYAAGPTDGA
jgi:hypothetical protein